MIHIDNLRLRDISEKAICCRLYQRLLSYTNHVGKTKVRRFITEEYYTKPLPGFGDRKAQLFVIGLAPAAHGGNRT